MSLPALEKYLRNNSEQNPPGVQFRKLILISDSKGRYLKDQVVVGSVGREILWCDKGGRTTAQAFNYLKQNIKRFLHQFGKILIVVWTGTCDLTKKVSNSTGVGSRSAYINLSGITTDDIICHYQNIVDFKKTYPDLVEIVILECPYYSISIWNSNKGHKNSSVFTESDKILHNSISDLNSKIRILNQQSNICAPKFSLDLLRARKSNKAHPVRTVSYSLLLDGIHPTGTLSRYWLRRLILAVLFRYCYK